MTPERQFVDPRDQSQPENLERRKMLGKILLGGGLAAFAGHASTPEENILRSQLHAAEPATDTPEPDALSGASRQHTNWAKFADLKKPMKKAKLAGLTMSRMILGGNLVLGYAHARDLIYVSDLVLAYHTKQKIFATFKMAEACGINTFFMNPSLCDMLKEYWEKHDGTLQFMTNCSGRDREGILANLQKSIDYGAVTCVIQGEVTDRLVREKDFDSIRAGTDLVHSHGLPVGLAAHRLETLTACVAEGIRPDYWVKTFHHHRYWSANPGEQEQDNIFCRDPEETAAFMADQPEPWMAFKVLAAGAVRPHDGFRYAFENGADFICVGMYDFQVVDDVNICNAVLEGELNRSRPWR